MPRLEIDAELRARLIGRAATIDERLGGDFVPIASDTAREELAERLDLWREIAARGDAGAFGARLAQLGLAEEQAAAWMGETRLRSEAAEPPWISWLDRALEAWRNGREPLAPRPETRYLPFDEIVRPLGREIVSGLDAGAASLLNEAGRLSLEQALAESFSGLFAPVLMESFSLFRGIRTGTFSAPEPTGERSLYDVFIAYLLDSGLRDVLLDYPVLARVAATRYRQLSTYTAELLHRLRCDLPVIAERLFDGAVPGELCDIRIGLSDPHDDGRSVAILHFSSGPRAVYKPRQTGIDAAWSKLLQWLEESGAPATPIAPRTIDCGGYGWFGWISHRPCRGQSDARRYYERAGALLCLATMLRGTDCHLENVIADGDNPVLVDLETLLHPRVRVAEAAAAPALQEAARRLANSVLATGFLPNWMTLPGDHLEEVGGVAFERWRFRETPIYKHVNTDAMTVGAGVAPFTDAHLPRLDGQTLPIGAYRDRLISGFVAMYRFLCASRARLLEPGGPLDGFSHLPVRVVLRMTWLYNVILSKSLKPRFLRSGAAWSAHFDFLARLEDAPFDSALLRAVQASERAVMARLDIPMFHADTSDTAVFGPGVRIDAAIERPAWNEMRERLLEWGEADLLEQSRMIEFAIDTAVQEVDDSATFAADRFESADLSLDAAGCVSAAAEIAEVLEQEALRVDGGAGWIGAMPLPGEQRCQLTEIGHNLLCGRGGVAVFLAAMQRCPGYERHGVLAREALAPIRRDIREPSAARRLMRMIGLGGIRGYGSIIYALTKAGELLEDGGLLEDAATAASLIDPEAIAHDRKFDVVAGAAGCALALLALYRATANSAALEAAVHCGRHLLVQRQEDCGGLWRTAGDDVLTGFSHGMAGIGYALTGLYEATGDPAFMGAAEACHDYERELFEPARRNWPDLRGGVVNTRFLCQWCHGAAGIGLARIGCAGVYTESALRAEIGHAVSTTRRWTSLTMDHACCGNFGRIELLLAAARESGDASLAGEAAQLAARVQARCRAAGGYRLIAGNDRQNPGFFFGLSGIGYGLLRLAMPSKLPSVLMMK